MEELTKKDAEILDKILELVRENQFVQLDTVIPVLHCSYYFGILIRFPEIVKISTTKPQKYHITSSTNTEEFKRNGGFRSLYEEQQKELTEKKKIEDLQLSNLSLENEEKRFRVRKQKTLFILAIIGSVGVVVGILVTLIKLYYSYKNGTL